jgi:Activator of Hsp90 ATPase homolog 1-like protein
VTFEIESSGQTVKLTVVHDDFQADSTMRAMVSTGWPHLLSDLKTLLETGDTLPPVPAEAWRG